MAHLTEKQPSTMTGAILMVGRRRRSRQYQGEPQSRVQILRGGYVHAEHWVKVSAGESVSIPWFYDTQWYDCRCLVGKNVALVFPRGKI